MINNSATNTQGLNTALNMCIDNKLNNSRFCTFAQVTSVNAGLGVINAQPIVAEPVNTSDGKIRYEILPEILNVPYFKGYKPMEGDYCILIHLDRGFWRVKGSNSKTDADFLRDEKGEFTVFVKAKNSSHTLSDCVAICGFANLNETYCD